MKKLLPKVSRSQPLRVMCKLPKLCTSKTVASKLWFVNNHRFEERTLAFLAKYVDKYSAELYGFALQGNHTHAVLSFPEGGQSDFFRDFNSRVAQNVKMYVDEFDEGPVFRSRYSSQALPENNDVEDYFLYCALQPVSSGLTQKIKDYLGYNCFNDAINEREREYKLVNYSEYKKAKKKNPNVSKYNFLETYALKYTRIPGYENLSSGEYKHMMLKKMENRRLAILKNPKHKNASLTKKELKKVKPGTKPKSTKIGGRRPLVLSSNPEAKRSYLEFYFNTVITYRQASKRFRLGNFTEYFPKGTFRPPGVCIVAEPELA